jgi:AcrR family transcriptional regulator
MAKAVEKLTPVAPRRGGRPSLADAEQIRDQILDVATTLLFTHGYGATSIEAVAKAAHMSKRTFYFRFRDKADLFGSVVHRLVERMRPRDDSHLFEGGSCEEILQRLALLILGAALSPGVLALHRMIVAEAPRFPELGVVLDEQGTRRDAVTRIAQFLEHETRAGNLKLDNFPFAAEQFLQLLVAAPQRRALGLGKAMSQAELEIWSRDAVNLFLNGCRGWQRKSA